MREIIEKEIIQLSKEQEDFKKDLIGMKKRKEKIREKLRLLEAKTRNPIRKKKKEKKMTKKEISTAYHEAGHAVMACQLGRKFKKVSIIKDGDTLGFLVNTTIKNFRPDIDPSLRIRSLIEREIKICFAGFEAEKKFRGKGNWKGAMRDFHECAQLASSVNGSSEQTGAFLKWLRIQTKDVVSYPYVWEEIEKVAKELLIHKELSYKKVREIIYPII